MNKPRIRDLNVPLDGITGPLNAITDVGGLEVGHTTLIEGKGKLVVGEGPVRTGVTAILPTGKRYDRLFGAWYSLNGNGEMTGTTWLEESGFLEGPVMITNTHSVGVVRDAVVEWSVSDAIASRHWFALPVVAETYDGVLNDINGFHVSKEHAFAALNNAKSGPVAEGNVGGGTGMICHGFKGGIGTASRIVATKFGNYTVGALVQANYGRGDFLTITGIPVGREIDMETIKTESEPDGSIIVVIATDAPLLPHQLKRLARRVPMGLARLGSIASHTSGDIFIAFSTANQNACNEESINKIESLPNGAMNPFFEASIQSTEEAILNALAAAETMTGIDDKTVYALPHDQLQKILAKYNRLAI